MADGIIVGAIVFAAGVFAVYRLILRPKCGCGSGHASGVSACRAGKAGSCSCGK